MNELSVVSCWWNCWVDGLMEAQMPQKTPMRAVHSNPPISMRTEAVICSPMLCGEAATSP